jgi:hypothetical protein
MRVSVVLVALSLCACASAPVEETKAFSSAVAAVNSSIDTILDDFNIAERNRFYRQRGRAYGLRAADEAYYYSTIAEAPATAQFRRAIRIIREYSELLRILVDGTNLESARGQALTLADAVASLAPNSNFKAAVAALSPILDQLITETNVAEARRLAVEGKGPLRRLIGSLRAAAPHMLDEFLTDIQAKSSTSQEEINRRAAERRLAISNYIVLLDRLDETFAKLMQAYEHPTNSITLTALVKASAQLEADVQASRKALAILRNSAS